MMAFLLMLGVAYASLCGAEHTAAGRGAATRISTRTAGFLSTSNSERRKELHEAISASVGSVLGARRDLASLRASLMPMWQALAKNSHDRIDHRSLHYAVHRYLLKAHGISVVGLEPTVAKNQTGDVAFLKTQAPLLVKKALEGAAAEEGFSLDDLVAMIIMLEHFVKMSSEPHLQELFRLRQVSMDDPFSGAEFAELMQSQLFEAILSGDDQGIGMIRKDASLVQDFFENWEELVLYVNGSIEGFRSGKSISAPRRARNPFKATFTFSDALDVAGDMSLSIGRYWDTECAKMKDTLVALDTASTGRVRLADFHNAALNGEWRFSESKEYLRHLGALDETSSWLGPQVIVANYVQGPSNCIVSTPAFRVCCMNACEGILGDIEEEVCAPAVAPERILSAVARMTAHDDGKVAVPSQVKQQLYNIAGVHHGVVPLHGRLFAQWLHYLSPTECPYPHKSGTMGSMSVFEYGNSLASRREIQIHAATAGSRESWTEARAGNVSKLEEDYLSLWSQEEELISTDHRPPSISPALAFAAPVAVMLACAAALASAVKPSKAPHRLAKSSGLAFFGTPPDSHAHII